MIAFWAVELPDAGYATPALPPDILIGGAENHLSCEPGRAGSLPKA